MKLLRTLPLLMLTTLIATGCGDDQGPEDTGLTLSDLTGSWSAASHVFRNNANPSQTFDLIVNGGETRITVLQGGGARTWVTIGTFSDEWDAQLNVSGTNVTSTPAEAARGVTVWSASLVGNTLTLTNENSTFDFTLQGGPEVSATETVTMVRQ